MNKKQLGQFFTKNSDHILQGFECFVAGKIIVDPFAGGRDLMLWARRHRARRVIGFDVDENFTSEDVELRDSLLDPVIQDFILTNPPYLYVNKATNEIKKKYFELNPAFDDLYQISIASLMGSKEGIIIVPINFLSADNARNVRRLFFEKFSIDRINYFTYQVFPDTTYNVIAAHYRLKQKGEERVIEIPTKVFFQDGRTESRIIPLRKEFHWGIGREFIQPIMLTKNSLGIYRFEEDHLRYGPRKARLAAGHIKHLFHDLVANETIELLRKNIILLKAIDSGSSSGRIALEDIRVHDIDGLVSKSSSRHMIQLIFREPLPLETQKELIIMFNSEFNKIREQTFSLFLTNYRDKNRKRVSFDFVYKMLNYLYEQKLSNFKARSDLMRLPLPL